MPTLGKDAAITLCWDIHQKKLGVQEEIELLLEARMASAERFDAHGLFVIVKRIAVLSTLLQEP